RRNLQFPGRHTMKLRSLAVLWAPNDARAAKWPPSPYPDLGMVRLLLGNDSQTLYKEATLMKLHRLLALLAVLALAVFTSTALAGGGNGNGGDKSGATSGQQQSQSAHESKQSSTSASQPATGGDNSKGVKPSN